VIRKPSDETKNPVPWPRDLSAESRTVICTTAGEAWAKISSGPRERALATGCVAEGAVVDRLDPLANELGPLVGLRETRAVGAVEDLATAARDGVLAFV